MSHVILTIQIKILLFSFVAAIWVGGGGYLMFRYAEYFARLNERLGFRVFATHTLVKIIRWVGMIEMLLASLGVINAIAMSAFGWL